MQRLAPLHASAKQRYGVSLALRCSIHSGIVVVGDIGTGRHAIGSPPQLAVWLQAIAAADTVVVSATTWELVAGYVLGQKLGQYQLSGQTTPLPVYHILQESGATTRFEVMAAQGPPPRERNIGKRPLCILASLAASRRR